jgi:hypothetical protein
MTRPLVDLVDCAGCDSIFLRPDTCIEVKPDQGGGRSRFFHDAACLDNAREAQVTS